MDKLILSASFRRKLEILAPQNAVANLLTGETTTTTTTENINYLTLRKDGLISYLPANKEHKVNPDTGEWLRDGRQEGKPAKVARKALSIASLNVLKDKDFEEFANLLKADCATANGLKFTEEDCTEIANIYSEEVTGGSIEKSCMQGKPSDFFEIYEKCNSLKILTLRDNANNLRGRALLWQAEADEYGTITFCDRFYVTADHEYQLFIDYCEDKGYWRKHRYNSFDSKRCLVNPSTGNSETVEMKVDMLTDFDKYPYADTFSFLYDGYLANYTEGDMLKELDSTTGGYSGYDRVETIDGEYINEENAAYVGGDWYSTDDERIVYSHIYGDYILWEHAVEVGGEYYEYDDNRIIEDIDGEYILKNEAVEIGGDWYSTDDDRITYSFIYSDYILMEEATKIGDDWYNKDDEDVVCTIDDEYILREDAVEIGGYWYHEDDERIADLTQEA